jgi:hypothetical protein
MIPYSFSISLGCLTKSSSTPYSISQPPIKVGASGFSAEPISANTRARLVSFIYHRSNAAIFGVHSSSKVSGSFMVSKDFQNYKTQPYECCIFDCASAWVIVKGKKKQTIFS